MLSCMAEDLAALDIGSAEARRDFWLGEYHGASADGDAERAAEALARVRRLNWLIALIEASKA